MKLTKYMIIFAFFIASSTFHLSSHHPSPNKVLSLVKDSFFLDQDSYHADKESDKNYLGTNDQPYTISSYLELEVIITGAKEQLPIFLQHLVTVFHQGNYLDQFMKDLAFNY